MQAFTLPQLVAALKNAIPPNQPNWQLYENGTILDTSKAYQFIKNMKPDFLRFLMYVCQGYALDYTLYDLKLLG